MGYEHDGTIYPDGGTQTPNQLADKMDEIHVVSRNEWIKNFLLGRTTIAKAFYTFAVLSLLYGAGIRN